VWLYHRFPLGFREVEEMMLARGIVVSHEMVRQWCAKFGQTYANGLRRRRPRPGDKWHVVEVFITIGCKTHDRAVRCDGGRGDRVAPPPGPLARRLSPGLIVTIRIRRVVLIRITLARSDFLANTARGALRSRHPAWSGGLPDRRLGRPGPTTLLRRMSAGVPAPRRRRSPASTTLQRAEFHR
jgi:hypothetical protein